MGMNHLSFGYEASKLWVRIILALGTNHLNFGYESSGYETSVGTKRPVSIMIEQQTKLDLVYNVSEPICALVPNTILKCKMT